MRMGTRVGTNGQSATEARTDRNSLPGAFQMMVGLQRRPGEVGLAVCRRAQGDVAYLRASHHHSHSDTYGQAAACQCFE